MEVQLSAERQAQLAEYAQRHGQDPSAALDEILAEAVEMEQQHYQATVEAIRRSYKSVKAGRTRPISGFMDELRSKYGF